MIQETNDYSIFKFLGDNREVNEGHVHRLKQAFEDFGNLTKVQPILVNERMEIIDGQHRLAAAIELGQPVFYTKASGLRTADARQMNILHRSWGPEDYAKSYAESGMKDYQTYRKIKEEYGITHKIALIYLGDTGEHGIYKKFREGAFTIRDLELSKRLLNLYQEVDELLPFSNYAVATALNRIFKVPGYDQKQMLRKLAMYGDHMLRPMSSVIDNLKQLEEVYNYKQNEENRLRLF